MTDNELSSTNIPQSDTAQPIPHWSGHRRRGQIARMPKAIRKRLNEMIEDGVPYLDIIQSLGPDGKDLTEDKLSKWRNSGYREWLEECRLTDAIRARYEFAETLVTEAGDPEHASRAVLHTMAVHLCHMLTEMDPNAIRGSLLSDSDKFSRFVNAMVRLAEGSIKCEQHQNKVEDRAAEIAKAKLPRERPGISDEALAIAEAKLRLM
jgi:hypothetical protein